MMDKKNILVDKMCILLLCLYD